MLTVIVPGNEYFDNEAEEFVTDPGFELHLEHSLVALSKWESEFQLPFLNNEKKTEEQVLGYIRCMIVNREIPEDLFRRLSADNIGLIQEYMNAKMTATWFPERPAGRNQEVVTAELLYYYMISFGIPFECEHWHLNRLFTLLRVFAAKQEKPKKMNSTELAAKRRELNEQRRAQLKTNG